MSQPTRSLDTNICPQCHHSMRLTSPQHYCCDACQHDYIKQFLCPICGKAAQLIQGCGAVNYLCLADGLISSKKVIIHYLPVQLRAE